MLELLSLNIGVVVVKHAVAHWTGDGVVGDVAGELITGSAKSTLGFVERRRLAREFDQLADRIAEKLSNAVEHELQALPSNEREAVILAAGATLSASSLGATDLLQDGLDPQAVLARIKAADTKRLQLAALSEAGEQLYGFLLNEACNYLVEISSSLPGFSTAMTQELLRRDGAMLDLLQQALSNLPQPLTPAEWGPSGNDDKRWENQYRRQVQRDLDTLELFGLDVHKTLQRYQLQVGFISLSTSTVQSISAERSNGVPSKTSVQEALASGRRFIVRGWAGSGKTTLVQWLAVVGARRAFEGHLQAWNGLVPFFVQLRRWGDTDGFPAPEEFAKFVTPLLVGIMPQGYVHRVLSGGLGLVLIDGIDEVREERRDDAQQWLAQLVATFPDCVFVATSRPTAVDESWTTMDGFRTTDLQPMSTGDIRRFITQWHAANSSLLAPDEQAAFIQSSAELSRLVEGSAALRNLAASPLLCAMLCALHQDRLGAVPENQAELCRVLIEVLAHRRDEARKLVLDPPFSTPEQDVLLRLVALWLLENDQSDIPTDRLQRLVENRLPYLPRVAAGAREVTDHLVARSGILREPVPGRVDFIHRTFLEYLAARQLIADESIGKLIANADKTHWHDVVTLACTICNPRSRHELLAGLLEHAERRPEVAHQLRILAIGCLRVSTELDPVLRQRLDELATRLLPPQSLDDAAALAGVGDVVVPFLTYEPRDAITQRACIRTLQLVGSTSALVALAGYADSTEAAVRDEVLAAWSSFDLDEFATVVVTKLAPIIADLDDPALLPHLSKVSSLRDVRCHLFGRVTSGAVFEGVPDIVTLIDLSNCPVSDLSFLGGRRALRHLDLEGTAIRDLNRLARSPIAYLNLSKCTGLTDLGPLSTLAKLEHADVRGLLGGLLASFPRLAELRSLSTDDAVWRTNLLSKVPGLRTLEVSDCTNASLTFLLGLSKLKSLRLTRFEFLEDLDELAQLSDLEDLSIRSCPRLTDVSALTHLPNIHHVDIGGTDLHADVQEQFEGAGLRLVEGSATHARFERKPSSTSTADES